MDLIMEFLSRYEINLVFRIVVSCFCGIAIGTERKSRDKEAGKRTHCIVALASAMMMIVSKYAFGDLIGGGMFADADVRLDPSRMAQGIVTGVGFLGSGMIYHHRGSTQGLTTAAGVWATSGIGMAIGAGMYTIGIASTAMILIVQYILHTKSSQARPHKSKTLRINNVPDGNLQQAVTNQLAQMDISVMDTSIKRDSDNMYEYSFYIEMPRELNEEDLLDTFDYACSLDFIH